MSEHEKKILGLIKNAIKHKDPEAEIILYGSRARGDAGKESDWDILILLNRPDVNRLTEKEYRDELFDIQLETGESISTFVFSKNDWENKHSITPFYQSIQQDGIRL